MSYYGESRDYYGERPPYEQWEPSARRAFYVESATGRAEWTLPADVSYGEASRAAPGPEYGYASPPPPPAAYPPQGYGAPAPAPGGYPAQGYGGEYQAPEEKEKSDKGKILAAGAAGLAIGAVGGAILGHELAEDSEEEEEHHSHHSDDEPHYSDYDD
ncbi:uncharacterized protein DSM5745_09162 [Aspergillus mulundensis]|uniref:WW domain-containing protein n=1 Tax=Aspergillus mulundensis TaxID=1810919 RepID=A0A3D8QZS1_9EURO|nr:hypothetical protein DSM5745_09162 [Aspergillus mulundensis]RDW67296.1 hypothetical protein DSM5745_09162 [Aspergillus mulundensis]